MSNVTKFEEVLFIILTVVAAIVVFSPFLACYLRKHCFKVLRFNNYVSSIFFIISFIYSVYCLRYLGNGIKEYVEWIEIESNIFTFLMPLMTMCFWYMKHFLKLFELHLIESGITK